jgi:hypothetical protein
MRLLQIWEPESCGAVPLSLSARERLDVRLRQETAEVTATPRCPRCGHELVARMGRLPLFWCGCRPCPGGAAALSRSASAA